VSAVDRSWSFPCALGGGLLFSTQKVVIELADLLQRLLEVDRKSTRLVAFTAGGLGAIGAMGPNGAIEERAAQDFAGNRQPV